jgi:hypothetical protein
LEEANAEKEKSLRENKKFEECLQQQNQRSRMECDAVKR